MTVTGLGALPNKSSAFSSALIIKQAEVCVHKHWQQATARANAYYYTVLCAYNDGKRSYQDAELLVENILKKQ
jgi:hypothetical protein